jgi:import inner membrane translocase subunit TIM44
VVGVTGNAYWAEYESKEVRDQKRAELSKLKEKKVAIGPDGLPISQKAISADEESSGIVMHKSGRLAAAWEKFKNESPVGQSLHNYSRSIEESDNLILRAFRAVKDKFKSDESDAVKVVRAFKSLDPEFSTDEFISELAHFIIPELLEASLQGDRSVLSEWLSEGVIFN